MTKPGLKIKAGNAKKIALIYSAVFLLLCFVFVRLHIENNFVNTVHENSGATYLIYFEHLPIQAKAVYVWDTNTNNILYEKNQNVPLPIASITKIMTSVCALETLGRNATIQIQKSDIETEGDSSLLVGEKWQLSDLVSFMLVESSNDAAVALGRTFGGTPAIVSCMNNKAQDLGLFETKFANETGLDIGTSPGAYGSAENVAMMFNDATEEFPQIFERTAYKSYNVLSLSGVLHTATNTDIAIDSIPGIVASKTGNTDLAGGNLVFKVNEGVGHTVIIALLGSTEAGRFTDAELLSQATAEALNQNTQND